MTVSRLTVRTLRFDGSKVSVGELLVFLEGVPSSTEVIIRQTFSSGDYGGSYPHTKVMIVEDES